jgi:hypothetical protein
MLMSLAQRVNQTRLQEKDPDAENLLGRELGANSDALYIMAQTVLVQDIALQQAKAQVTQLQQQVQQAQQQPAHATSFLGGLFGRHDSAPPTQPPSPTQLQPSQMQPGPAPAYQPVPQYQQPGQPQYYPPPPPQYGAPYAGAPPYGGAAPFGAVPMGQPSFLRGAMQTAAGVAAGALAFEGVESILHGFGHGGGYGGGFGGFGGGMSGMGMGGGFGRPVEETVVNNYYETPGAGGGLGAGGLGAGGVAGGMMGAGEHNFSEAGNDQAFQQTGDQGGYQLADATSEAQGGDNVGQGGYDTSMADDSAAYDSGADDVQIADDGGGGFDDGGGGGFDSGGDNS